MSDSSTGGQSKTFAECEPPDLCIWRLHGDISVDDIEGLYAAQRRFFEGKARVLFWWTCPGCARFRLKPERPPRKIGVFRLSKLRPHAAELLRFALWPCLLPRQLPSSTPSASNFFRLLMRKKKPEHGLRRYAVLPCRARQRIDCAFFAPGFFL